MGKYKITQSDGILCWFGINNGILSGLKFMYVVDNASMIAKMVFL